MNAYLIRHPETIANVRQLNDCLDGDLTDWGRLQLRCILPTFKRSRIDRVYSSPARRCRLLAQAIADAAGAPITFSDKLRERDYGDLVGKEATLLPLLGLEGRPNGGESVIDVYERAQTVLQSVTGGSVVLVSHGLVLKMLLAVILKADVGSSVMNYKLSNCGITRVDVSGARLDVTNDVHHLPRKVKRVHIFGGWATGKTTLARELGCLLQVPVISLDDLKYPRGFASAEPLSCRLQKLDEITSGPKWITEGAWTDYADMALERAELLIYIKAGYFKAIQNALRREQTRQRPEGTSLLRLLAALTFYHLSGGVVSLRAHNALAERFLAKVVPVNCHVSAWRVFESGIPSVRQA